MLLLQCYSSDVQRFRSAELSQIKNGPASNAFYLGDIAASQLALLLELTPRFLEKALSDLGDGSDLERLASLTVGLRDLAMKRVVAQLALDISQEIGYCLGEGGSLGNLGNGYTSLGKEWEHALILL